MMVPIKNGDIIINGTPLNRMTSITEGKNKMTSQYTNSVLIIAMVIQGLDIIITSYIKFTFNL